MCDRDDLLIISVVVSSRSVDVNGSGLQCDTLLDTNVNSLSTFEVVH